MTTRIKGFTVALEKDIREDDCKHIVDAIMMVKGVLSVDGIESDSSDYITKSRIKREIATSLYEFIDEINAL
jgi:hypothetical protein